MYNETQPKPSRKLPMRITHTQSAQADFVAGNPRSGSCHSAGTSVQRLSVIPRLLATLLLAILLLPLPTVAAPQAAARQGIGELYLALGDSLGVGLLSSAPDARGYVAQLQTLLQKSAGRHAEQLHTLQRPTDPRRRL